MKKIYKLEDLDCANCALKMEKAILKIEGVKEASVSFINQKLIIDLDEDNFEKIMDEVVKTCKKVEPDCIIKR